MTEKRKRSNAKGALALGGQGFAFALALVFYFDAPSALRRFACCSHIVPASSRDFRGALLKK